MYKYIFVALFILYYFLLDTIANGEWLKKLVFHGLNSLPFLTDYNIIQDMMSPRRKSTKISVAGGSNCSSFQKEELKDYINELSHEVLCHIFRLVLCTSFFTLIRYSALFFLLRNNHSVCIIYHRTSINFLVVKCLIGLIIFFFVKMF